MHRLLLIGLLMAAPTLAAAQDSHATMNHDAMMTAPDTAPVSEPGQGAFAAVAEIVAALEADPETDWTTVDIAGLREHLRDMDVVMIDTQVTSERSDGGLRFTVTGGPDVYPSIQRMTAAHASVMQGVNGWQYDAAATDKGATLTVSVPVADLPKLRALGFFGLMASGMHHQAHHWRMATGANPHG